MNNAPKIKVEQREKKCAPIVHSEVCSNLYYSVALIDKSNTFIYWYVTDVLGFDLNKGYDTYKSESGRTVIPWCLPEYEKYGTIVIIDQESSTVPSVGRFEMIPPFSILCVEQVCYDDDNDKVLLAPLWFGKLMSYSCSSIL